MHTTTPAAQATATKAINTPTLNSGEHYAGPVLDEAGQIKHHLVLLPERPARRLSWQDAMAWADGIGAQLPDRQEQALLFANCKPHLQPGWHWSCKEDEEDASYACVCDFSYGDQLNLLKSFECSAVAVRRLPLESFFPFASAAEGTFTHTPRPAIVPVDAKYANQRRFGPGSKALDYYINPQEKEARACDTRLEIYRDGECDVAEVRVKLGLYTSAEITTRLNPAELRDLAARLIDAAHDIETLPAAVLARAQKGGAA